MRRDQNDRVVRRKLEQKAQAKLVSVSVPEYVGSADGVGPEGKDRDLRYVAQVTNNSDEPVNECRLFVSLFTDESAGPVSGHSRPDRAGWCPRETKSLQVSMVVPPDLAVLDRLRATVTLDFWDAASLHWERDEHHRLRLAAMQTAQPLVASCAWPGRSQ